MFLSCVGVGPRLAAAMAPLQGLQCLCARWRVVHFKGGGFHRTQFSVRRSPALRYARRAERHPQCH